MLKKARTNKITDSTVKHVNDRSKITIYDTKDFLYHMFCCYKAKTKSTSLTESRYDKYKKFLKQANDINYQRDVLTLLIF